MTLAKRHHVLFCIIIFEWISDISVVFLFLIFSIIQLLLHWYLYRILVSIVNFEQISTNFNFDSISYIKTSEVPEKKNSHNKTSKVREIVLMSLLLTLNSFHTWLQCVYYWIWANFAHCFSACIIDFEQVFSFNFEQIWHNVLMFLL